MTELKGCQDDQDELVVLHGDVVQDAPLGGKYALTYLPLVY